MMQLWILFVAITVAFGMALPNPPLFTKTSQYPSICYLPPDSGICESLEFAPQQPQNPFPHEEPTKTSHYFDAITAECYPFSTQNCGGNENRFKTLNDCQQTCKMT